MPQTWMHASTCVFFVEQNTEIQCDAIRWEQILRKCRLGQLNMAYWHEDSAF